MASNRSTTTTIIPVPNASGRGIPSACDARYAAPPRDGGRRIDLTPQDKRYLRRDDVSQDASGNASHRAHQHHDERWALRRFRQLGPGKGEKRQAQRVGHEEGGARRWPYPYICDRQDGGYDDDDEVPGIGDPENRVAVQEEIAKGTASDGCNHRDHDDPEEIQIPITRRQYAARGKHCHTCKVKVIKGEHALSYAAECPRRRAPASAGRARFGATFPRRIAATIPVPAG